MPTRAVAVAALLAVSCAHSGKRREAAEIHYDLGVEALRAGRHQDALKEFDAALKLDADFAEARLGRGVLLEHVFDRRSDAEREYRRALELRPGYPEAHNNLGQLLARGGRLEEAVPEFDAALGDMLYKEPWVARCNKGQALWRLGRRDEGLTEMKTCLDRNPRYCAGHRELGRMHLADGRLPLALASLQEYARFCERTADAHYQLGLAQLRAGDAERARASFERCETLGEGSSLGAECRRSRELLQ